MTMNSQKNREVICINLILITLLIDFHSSELQHFGGERYFLILISGQLSLPMTLENIHLIFFFTYNESSGIIYTTQTSSFAPPDDWTCLKVSAAGTSASRPNLPYLLGELECLCI